MQPADAPTHAMPGRMLLRALLLALIATLVLVAAAHADTTGTAGEGAGGTTEVLTLEGPAEQGSTGGETTGTGSGETPPAEETTEVVIPPVEEVPVPPAEEVALPPVEETSPPPTETTEPKPAEEPAKPSTPASEETTEGSSQTVVASNDHSGSGPTAGQGTLAYTATEITSETGTVPIAATLPTLAGPLVAQEMSSAELKLESAGHTSLLARVSLSCLPSMGSLESNCTTLVITPQGPIVSPSGELVTAHTPWTGSGGGPPEGGGGSAGGSRPVDPSPGPPPSGASGGAAVGGSGLAPPAFLTLAGLLLLAGPLAMRRLRLSSQPWLTAFFVLIPERPG